MEETNYIKGRGAQKRLPNKFSNLHEEMRDDFLNYCEQEGEEARPKQTTYIPTFPKTIVNKVNSPDVGMQYSLNPYQGCEHGCVYCYARNSHEYWGLGAGLDFEQKILIKKNAPELLEKKLKSKHWEAIPIGLSGNTDCYQPVERTMKLTRSLLEVFLKYRHPVGIITKNSLILRDLDLLKPLAEEELVRVYISITSLEERTRQLLEPRTASIKKRLETVEQLSKAGIPVRVMMAPIIPSLNDHEIIPLVREVAARGALDVGHTVVRLNGALGLLFEDWLQKALPDRAQRILNQIAACHGGQLNDSRFGTRMKGEGQWAEHIKQQFSIARAKYLTDRSMPELNCALHSKFKHGQWTLF
ncbi:PA0069 family radical SAM protein [Croceiramulus getboli]|nr:PA0069 family radical SAM protein [Flavobacteriaceae bacterium YJPT1-3]